MLFQTCDCKSLKIRIILYFCIWIANFSNFETLQPPPPFRVNFYVSWPVSRCQFLTSTFIENISVSVVRCLHQCRHFGAEQQKMSWITFMTSWASLLDLHQQTVPDTLGYIYMYIEEAIVTRRKRITILNALINVCVFLIQYFAYCFKHSWTAVFDAKYRIYSRNKSLISFKTGQIFM